MSTDNKLLDAVDREGFSEIGSILQSAMSTYASLHPLVQFFYSGDSLNRKERPVAGIGRYGDESDANMHALVSAYMVQCLVILELLDEHRIAMEQAQTDETIKNIDAAIYSLDTELKQNLRRVNQLMGTSDLELEDVIAGDVVEATPADHLLQRLQQHKDVQTITSGWELS